MAREGDGTIVGDALLVLSCLRDGDDPGSSLSHGSGRWDGWAPETDRETGQTAVAVWPAEYTVRTGSSFCTT